MKNISLFLLLGLFAIKSQAQNFQMTIKPSSTASSIRAVIRPGITINNAQISSAQVTVLIPASVGEPRPTAVIKNNPITGLGYLLFTSTETTPDGTYFVYEFDGVGNATVPATNYIAGTEYDLLEIQFTNRPDVSSQVRLAQLPNGGTSGESPGNYNFFLALNGVDVVNQTAPFYGSISSNDGQGYAGYSFAALNNVVLPVNWLKFTAVRQGNDVMLNWDVADERNTDRYEVEVSPNGVDFAPFATKQRTSGSGSKNYNHLDKQVGRYNSKILHYRIKQYDLDGKFSYSPIKTVRLDVKGETSLFPNPAKEGFTLTIPYLNPNQDKVQLHLVNPLGQVVDRKDITRLAAVNYYYNLQSSLITSGEYLLKIFEDGQLTETKRVLIKK